MHDYYHRATTAELFADRIKPPHHYIKKKSKQRGPYFTNCHATHTQIVAKENREIRYLEAEESREDACASLMRLDCRVLVAYVDHKLAGAITIDRGKVYWYDYHPSTNEFALGHGERVLGVSKGVSKEHVRRIVCADIGTPIGIRTIKKR